MITKEALSNKYANKEHELCLYEFVVVIVLDYAFQCLDYIEWIRLNYMAYYKLIEARL